VTRQRLGGVLPVFQTPFTPQGHPDLSILEAEIRWLFANGVDGVVMGMVSEVLRLSEVEVDTVASHVVSVAQEFNAPVVVSVGAESTHSAVANARRAEAFGAAALMAIPPLSTPASDAQKFSYYESILEAVSIPVIIQDASGYVGQPLSISVQARLLDIYPDQVLFKPEAPPIGSRVSALRQATGGRARIFEGTGGIALVDSYRRGIVGTMPGADLCWALVALWHALESGDEEATWSINGPLVSLISLQTNLDLFVAVEKHLLRLQGVFDNTIVRGPVAFELDVETTREVERLFWRLRDAVNTYHSTSGTEQDPTETGRITAPMGRSI
jgi:dihydrodipicolinate synthase/N-acetylneuraminate lyase